MSSNPLKVAIVGLGWWANPIGAAAKNSPKLDLAQCFTRNPEKRKEYAEKYGCAEAESFEAILADDSIEGILLTTPNTAHASLIVQAFEAGKHVWVEKPIVNTLAEVPGALAAWRASGKVFSIGHCYRRAAGHRKMKELIEDGTVGKPLWAQAVFSNHMGLFFGPDRWRFFKDECPGGPLMQMGIHHCDTLQYLFGPPVKVTGVHARLATPAEIDDVTHSLYEHESGAVTSLSTSFVTPGTFTMRLHGTEAVISLEMIRENLTLAERTNTETILTIQKQGESGWTPIALPDVPDMITHEIEEFADCVREGKAPETGPKEAIYALAMVEGSCRSSEAGKGLEMKALLDGIDI